MAYFGDAFMNPDARESDLQQQQIQEKKEENLKNSMLVVHTLSLSLLKNIHACAYTPEIC